MVPKYRSNSQHLVLHASFIIGKISRIFWMLSIFARVIRLWEKVSSLKECRILYKFSLNVHRKLFASFISFKMRLIRQVNCFTLSFDFSLNSKAQKIKFCIFIETVNYVNYLTKKWPFFYRHVFVEDEPCLCHLSLKCKWNGVHVCMSHDLISKLHCNRWQARLSIAFSENKTNMSR